MYTTSIKSTNITIESSKSVFSPDSLDRGTAAMLDEIELPDGLILDLGCGCGVVGIYAAKVKGEENVVMCDISEEAVLISKQNAVRNGVENVKIYQSDGFKSVPETGFSLILTNPPYHSDFSVAKEFIEEGFRRLIPGGKIAVVTKRLAWYKNKLTSVFGGVKITERDGYYVFISQKREKFPRSKGKPAAKKLSRKLERKYGRGKG